MLRQTLIKLIAEAVSSAQKAGKLPIVAIPDITIERPQNPEHGDYATNLPLRLARAVNTNPLMIARELVSFIPPTEEIAKVTAAPPGFINFTLKDQWLATQVNAILRDGESFGENKRGNGSKVQVEFVSINPTGPLHVGHGRGAILGSTLANVLTANGYMVEKEYYFNDAGSQMNAFKQSLYARYMQSLGIQKEIPENGYRGTYMVDIAKEIITEYGEKFRNLKEEEAIQQVGELGVRKVIDGIKEELKILRVEYDVWFSEQSLYRDGQYKKVLEILRKNGYLLEKEGATWFVSTALGENKDNVVIRSDGSPTYFAADIAYHYNKFVERGFNRVINIWGADHQGHVSRLKAVVGALGIDPARLQIIIHQMVTLKRGGELVRVSKRTGDIITLREVMDEVGVDACRYFFLARSANSQMDFDLELAKKQSQDNPVYYIQYAHARIASILRLAQERQISFDDGDVSMLTTEAELTLIRRLLQLPEIIETIAITSEPHHLAYYAQDLATMFHLFYRDCRVVTDDEAMTKARLKLVKAAQIALAKTLGLMSMTAPDKM
ncbi:MAG: arginine--tRNA ligase [Chloroflexi bacterium RBG_13_46_9]|nr:MAG: arginine--tRNA ligase [Chloroflexi bacterium RBG_13_46_9]